MFFFQGLFHQVIAQSGSAIAPWAFDDNISHEGHTRNIAAMVNCNLPDVEDLVDCMKSVPASNITSAANSYSVSSFYLYHITLEFQLNNYLVVHPNRNLAKLDLTNLTI